MEIVDNIFAERKRVANLRRQLDDLIAEQLEVHPSIHAIHIVDFREPIGSKELYAKFGYDIKNQRMWNTDAEDLGYAEKEQCGGSCVPFDFDGNIKIVIFLKQDMRVNSCYHAHVCMLFHEMGHVDDFENGKLPIEGPVNLAMTETHAHETCCSELYQHGFMVCLKYYLIYGLSKMNNSGIDAYVEAGKRFALKAEEYRNLCLMVKLRDDVL